MDDVSKAAAAGRSRRAVLVDIGALGCAAGVLGGTLIAGPAAAATKLKQKAASYQDNPKGKQQCDNCRQWQPPAACKIVEGAISPAGWCMLYGPK